jgi:hypothetical protein
VTQQINLYNPAFVPPREYVTAKSLAVTVAVLLTLVAGTTTWARQRAQLRETELAEAQNFQKAAQAELEGMRAAAAARTENPALVAKVAAERRKIAEREQVLELTKGLTAESGGGYVEYLRGLARQTMAGVWLTGFAVHDGGRQISLSGRAVDKSLLPDFVRRLNSEPAFQGKAFAGMNIAYKDTTVPAAGAVPPAPTSGAKATPSGPSRYLEFELTAAGSSETKAKEGAKQ